MWQVWTLSEKAYILICRAHSCLDVLRVTSSPWLSVVRVTAYVIIQIGMPLRAKERALYICIWITVEIWNSPGQTEIDGHPTQG